MKVDIENLTFAIDNKELISKISLTAQTGELVGIVGPNGSGKSTLLKNIYRYHKPTSGNIYIDNKKIQQLSIKESAQNIAVLSQEAPVQFEFSVLEIVMMGRAPHKKLLESQNKNDLQKAHAALKKVGMLEFADRTITSLSGGEKQRVMLARALAQEAKILLLDEPTNHLDIYYKLQLMDLIKDLGTTVIAAIHDLNLAAEYCDKIYLLKEGAVFTYGNPKQVFTADILKQVFHIRTAISKNLETGNIHITYLPNFN